MFGFKGKRPWLRLVLAFFLLAGALAWYGVASYPGLVSATWYQFAGGGLAESTNVFHSLSHWGKFMELLELDEETGFMDFESVNREELSPLENGQLALHKGDLDEAVEILKGVVDDGDDSKKARYWLAVASLRKAEKDNAFPDEGTPDLQAMGRLPVDQAFVAQEDLDRAIELFRGLLDESGGENRTYKWLLNYCYMVAGPYPPDGRPDLSIQSAYIEHFYGDSLHELKAEHASLSLVDRAVELGVDVVDAGKGVAVEDFNGDGFLDIVTGGTFDRTHYFTNQGGLEFVDETEASGLGDVVQPHIITAADYDNDGWVDLFFGSLYQEFRLFRNVGGGRFEDVTESSGLTDGPEGETRFISWVSAWGDVDNDGDLDLFISQWGTKIPFTSGFLSWPRRDASLYINENGFFVNKTDEFGLRDVVHDRPFVGAAFGDYDNDGFPDLFISSPMKRASTLLHNLSGSSFEKIANYSSGFTCSFVDTDHDGNLEVFHAATADAGSCLRKSVFGEDFGADRTGRTVIWQRSDDGGLEEIQGFFDGELPIGTMGASYGDLNLDGCNDFYFGTGGPEAQYIVPNLGYLGVAEGNGCRNQATNISALEGLGTVQKGHGIVFFDFDEDGDQDIYSSLGGMWQGDRWPNQFFVNESEIDNTWLKIRLRGRQTNRFGVGARIKVDAVDAAGASIVRRYHMDNKAGFGSAPFLAHIGLGKAVEVLGVEVYWPVSGQWRRYEGELETLILLDEAEGLVIGNGPQAPAS